MTVTMPLPRWFLIIVASSLAVIALAVSYQTVQTALRGHAPVHRARARVAAPRVGPIDPDSVRQPVRDTSLAASRGTD